MKKLTLSVFALFIAFSFNANAQCTPDFTMQEAGLEPDSDSLACIIQGEEFIETIYFKNFEEVSGVTVEKLVIDSLRNIPCGINYTVDRPNRTYNSGEAGCIDVFGTTTDAAGQYKLEIYVTVTIQGIGEVSGEAGDLSAQFNGPDFSYFVRVKESGGVCLAVDTTESANNLVATCDATNVEELEKLELTEFSVTPNPVSNIATVSVYAENSAAYEINIHNIVGQVVKSERVEVINGLNSIPVNVERLNSGMYFLSITNGTDRVTQKLIVQ